MDEQMVAQLFKELGEIKGIQNQILDHLKKMNGRLAKSEENIDTLFKELGNVKGTLNSVKSKINDIENKVNSHSDEISKLRLVQERHKTYFKIMGSVIGIIVLVFVSLLPFLLKH
jgi:chromosome segregation ATPase